MNVLNIGKVIVRRASDGKYLVLRSSKWEERPDRSEKPDLAGGMVEAGETPEEGAARELQEEAGITANPRDLELVYTMTFRSNKDGSSINRLIYFLELADDPEVMLSWEHMEYMWLSKDEVRQLSDLRAPYPEIFAYLEEIGVLI